MIERPVLRIPFMDPLVLATMADKKTVTRRLRPPRFKVGDLVGVAEALVPSAHDAVVYRCDNALHVDEHGVPTPWPWKVRVLQARYCPGWAIRTWLRIVDIRQEPLLYVDDEDAVREGIARLGYSPTRGGFLSVFRQLHPGVDLDAVVSRIEFRREVIGG